MGDLVVLVIEDDESISHFLATNLARRGYTSHTARNGATGLEMAKSLRPALILLDLKLPEMSGWEVLEALRAQPEGQDVPVLVVTANAAGEDEDRARELGANGYLIKPVSVTQLMERIRFVLQGQV